MNKLNDEEKLLILAYAGIPTISNFAKNYQDLPKILETRATCIYVCSFLVKEMKESSQFPNHKIDKYFETKEMREFFDSLVSSNQDDPRDIKLIARFVEGLYSFTDSGMETYADFNPFLLFEHESWLQLIIHIQQIQNNDSAVLELKKLVNSFVAKGFSLILHPSLNEYKDSTKFFLWFEKLEFNEKEKLVSEAMKVWRNHEESGSYELSEEYGEKWYKAALEFAVRITSKEYVSKVFAESFKISYPKIYEKFRLLAGLDEFEIIVEFKVDFLKRQKIEIDKMELNELFGQYKHEAEKLAEIISKDNRIEKLAAIIFEISTNIADDRCEHTRETLSVLIEKYGNCELVKQLSSVFTKNLEQKIKDSSLSSEDLPPSPLYITNTDWHWLFG